MSDPCQLFNSIDVGEFDSLEDKLRFNALKECIPLNVTMELTQNCNFSCSHCYNFDRTSQNKNKDDKEALSPTEWKKVIKEARDAGGFFFCFTGGEVLTVNYLEDIILYAKELGASVRVKTNGALLSKQKAIRLKKAGVNDIEFSLYGANEDTHDSFTNSKGQFRKVLKGLEYAKAYGLSPICNIILHSQNADQYKKMKSLLDEMDIFSQVSLDLSIRHDGSRGSLDFRLKHNQLEKLFRENPKLLPHQNSSGNIQCSCARSNCGIGFDGAVYPCIGAPLFAGSLKEKSFKEIWKNSPVFQRIRGLHLKDYKTCQTCEERSFCQRSSGLIYLNTGTYTGAEDHTCKTAGLIRSLNEELR